MKNENGITLVALIIIVGVMLIITSVSVYNGTDSVNSIKLNGFYTQLEIVQEKVDDIATTNESYINGTDTVYIKETGEPLTLEQKNELKSRLNNTDIVERFKYFTIQDIKNILDLDEIDYNLFINFEDKIVVAEDGITIEGTTYYMLENTKFFLETDLSKNVGTIETLIYGTPIKYNNDTYKVTITPGNTIGDLDATGYIKYKKATEKYWETTTENYIVVQLDTVYNVIFTDLNKNKIEKNIIVEYKQDFAGNDILIVNEKIEEGEDI